MFKLIVCFVLFIVNNAVAAGDTGSVIAPPKYVGYFSAKGDLGWDSENYKSNSNYPYPPLLIHKRCNDVYPGSRAALYDDFKYIISSLPNSYYYVVDAHTDFYSSTIRVFKTGLSRSGDVGDRLNYCNNWSTTTNTNTSVVLYKTSSTAYFVTRSCANSYRVACVRD